MENGKRHLSQLKENINDLKSLVSPDNRSLVHQIEFHLNEYLNIWGDLVNDEEMTHHLQGMIQDRIEALSPIFKVSFSSRLKLGHLKKILNILPHIIQVLKLYMSSETKVSFKSDQIKLSPAQGELVLSQEDVKRLKFLTKELFDRGVLLLGKHQIVLHYGVHPVEYLLLKAEKGNKILLLDGVLNSIKSDRIKIKRNTKCIELTKEWSLRPLQTIPDHYLVSDNRLRGEFEVLNLNFPFRSLSLIIPSGGYKVDSNTLKSLIKDVDFLSLSIFDL